ncbi:MAG TPA: hypothetical protein VNK41_11965 [Vicinamibacterales bacterium]|nr:hypothetical protein [Vicinamibacterales bacterium]
MRILLFVIASVFASPAFAQDAVVTATAPIDVTPEAAKPIRTAAVGTILKVVREDREWVQVQFNDPQWGPRTGWVRATLLDISRPETTPIDLSIGRSAPRPTRTAASQAASDNPLQPPPSFAPGQPRDPSPFRVHTVGRAGATFGTATAALIGVEVSGDVLPVMQVYGSFDWHQDLIPKDIANAFSLLGDALGVDLDVKAPTYATIGGVKVIAPGGPVRPYGLGGFGVAHTRGKIILEGEDQTQLLLELAGLERSDISFTKPIAEGGGGIVIPAGRAWFDVGYRFRKILQIEGINVSGVYFGAGFSY